MELECLSFHYGRRSFTSPALEEISETLTAEWRRISARCTVGKGARVAITVGSRGIYGIDTIIRNLGRILMDAGAEPFIVPAMGSHGGATAEGQAEVLRELGITEVTVGLPIVSSMDVVEVGRVNGTFPVYVDRCAWEADHIVVVGRVKPHTDFVGKVESGLMKMMVIGLGNHLGASMAHTAFSAMGFERVIEAASEIILGSGKILCGIAILENHLHRTALLEAIEPGRLYRREVELLMLARKWVPGLPLDQLDLLIIDEIGKEISGTGMDTNVVGRKHLIHGKACPGPQIRRIYVRDLTASSLGNSIGIGLADYTHKRLVEKIDRKKTYANCNTANNPRSGAIPMYFDSDKQAIDIAIRSVGLKDITDARVVWVRDTLDLETFYASSACSSDLGAIDLVKLSRETGPLRFDGEGNIPKDSFHELYKTFD